MYRIRLLRLRAGHPLTCLLVLSAHLSTLSGLQVLENLCFKLHQTILSIRDSACLYLTHVTSKRGLTLRDDRTRLSTKIATLPTKV
jgi:hypothetical protein